MKKHLYTLEGLGALGILAALSFEPTVHFWTHWQAALPALGLTAVLYILWGSLLVHRGDWAFNPVFTGNLRFGGLPGGELLLVLAYPLAGLYLFEVVRTFFPGTDLWQTTRVSLYAGALVLVVGAWVFRHLTYTMTSLLGLAIFLSTLALTRPTLPGRSEFWIWAGFCTAFFAVADGIRTGLPALRVNRKDVLGLRVGPIPLENFFHQFAGWGLTLCFYLTFEGWFIQP